jgi:hypothetical protein
MFTEGELALELFLDVFSENLVLSQTFNDFVIERSQLADFILEGAFNVVAPESTEVAETNESLWVPVWPLCFDKLGERRPNILTDGAVLWQKSPATNLADEFS